ncbi:RelA/SpoT domain-containing protein [Bacillus cereus]|uniref:RelA/SpoT domain-containing protein n=1 Tax=Bacillus cereus TaxID=1396 RepID=UPI001F6039C9|nr:RelA/SpoT domain-containing protein [Bacillus cereus]MDA2440503.1 RelA/SpoT domain-containing protein [Bacillus cereus]MDA2446631.1 RelA/SpoT domain-containing protein [Bacillus cereus]
MKLMSKIDFFKKYNLTLDEEFAEKIKWEQLEKIYDNYITQIPSLNATASTIADILRSNGEVHSVRTRVKDPEHLIEKIIRKTKKKQIKETTYEINIDNYTNEITDLIGIRVLHLYKDQAYHIDKVIRNTWDLHETPIIYYRKGDFQASITENNEHPELEFQQQEHEFGYRSWHYLIKVKPTRIEYIAEVQVRTIFEEGWSEIDHQLRYPYDLNNDLLREQLMVLNRLAGSADEMVDTIRKITIRQYELIEQNKKSEQLIEELKQKLALAKVAGEEKKVLEEKVRQLEESQQRSIQIGAGVPGVRSSLLGSLSPFPTQYSDKGKIKTYVDYGEVNLNTPYTEKSLKSNSINITNGTTYKIE